MKPIKKAAAFIMLTLVSGLFTGCMAGVPTEPIVITPPPVTPLAPPEGIRASIRLDPSQMYGGVPQVSEETGPISAPPTAGLHSCIINDEREIEADAIAIGEFSANVNLQVCGWSAEKAWVNVSIASDRGDLIEDQIQTGDDFFYRDGRNVASIYRQVAVSEQTTAFEIEMVGDDGVFSAEQTFYLPKEPRVYAFESGDGWLYGFEANEEVQLFRYDVSERGWSEWEHGGGITETYTLVAHEIVTVESDGTYAARQFLPAGYGPYGIGSMFYALGEKSGLISQSRIPPFVESILIE